MARPKSTAPIKGKINLSISEQTRQNLIFVAQCEGLSVSELVSQWAEKAARKAAKAHNKPLPDATQLTLDDVEMQGGD